jgi:hypothetical protein
VVALLLLLLLPSLLLVELLWPMSTKEHTVTGDRSCCFAQATG